MKVLFNTFFLFVSMAWAFNFLFPDYQFYFIYIIYSKYYQLIFGKGLNAKFLKVFKLFDITDKCATTSYFQKRTSKWLICEKMFNLTKTFIMWIKIKMTNFQKIKSKWENIFPCQNSKYKKVLCWWRYEERAGSYTTCGTANFLDCNLGIFIKGLKNICNK